MYSVHIFGSVLAFVGGCMYLWIIVSVTMKSKTSLNYSTALLVARIVLSSLATLVGLGCILVMIYIVT